MKLLVIVLAGLAAVYGLHRLALWAEARGYVYYKRRGSSGALGNALLEVQAIVEPTRRHVLEERVREKVDEQDSGDPQERP